MPYKNKKVFVSGCYDLLHSGHVEFFRQAAEYGDLYVGIGSDKTILGYKHHRTVYSEQERLFMVKSIHYVKDAFINSGSGIMDFVPTVERLCPDIFVVNGDGDTAEKRNFCEKLGIEYVVLQRVPQEGLQPRSSTDLKKTDTQLPTRLDLAGTWIDQPYVSCHAPGWAITISLEPTFEIRTRCGLSTSTRNVIKKIWPYQLPINMDPEMLARLVFCFENHPEREGGHVSGAQDAIGICVPGLCRHWYDKHFWPEKIEACYDENILSWLEEHICMIPMFPRRPGCSVVENTNINKENVEALAKSSDDCWTAILARDLQGFAAAYKASFEAQVRMFPGMINPSFPDLTQSCPDSCPSCPDSCPSCPTCSGISTDTDGFLPTVQAYIDKYSTVPGILAWKMPGAGGGGYLVLVCESREAFPEDAIPIVIRRPGM